MSRTAEITIRPRLIPSQEKVKRKLSWRDSWIDKETGEVNEIFYEGEGGDIHFFYNGKRPVPYVVDVFILGTKNGYAQMKKYVDGLSFPHVVTNDVPNTEISIQIDEKAVGEQFQDILFDLESSLFGSRFCDYEVDVK